MKKNNDEDIKNDINAISINSYNINIIYQNDYLLYKKKYIKNIIDNINLISGIFDKDTNEMLTFIYVLKKKNKIDNENYKLFNEIYNLINYLNDLNYIDQEELLIILLFLFKIYIIIPHIQKYLNNLNFNREINFDYFFTKFNEIYSFLLDKSSFLSILTKLILLNNDKNLIKKNLRIFVKILSIDYFMYYDSNTIYNKIFNNIIVLNDNINEISNITKILIKNKNYIINEYEKNIKKHFEIYFNLEYDLKLKFKFEKNTEIINLIYSFNYIDKFN